MLQISELYIYPIKSFPGIRVAEAKVTEKGFEHDRRWMLVDENNVFISQREAPQMTQFKISVEVNGLKVMNSITATDILIPFAPGNIGRQNERYYLGR